MTHDEIDTMLNLHPGIKAAVYDVLDRATLYVPLYPTDPIHAASDVSVAAGELMKRAQGVYNFDTVKQREALLKAAIAVSADCLRFLTEIGNLKGQELPE